MKKFLFTLATLFIPCCAFADSGLFFPEQVTLTMDQLGTEIELTLGAHFDARVSGFECWLTFPEGITATSARAGNDRTIQYYESNGTQSAYNANFLCGPNFDHFYAYNDRLGYWLDPASDEWESYGVVKWEAGDYNDMVRYRINVAEDFTGGDIIVSTQVASGNDTRGGTVRENGQQGQTFTFICHVIIEDANIFEVNNIRYFANSETTAFVIKNNYSGNINIPASVTYNGHNYSVIAINHDAFKDCKSLTNVTIPSSVTSIGNSAFQGCSNLTSVTIPNSVTSIGNAVFQGCSNLTSVNIPSSVTSIGNSLFQGCSNLTSVTIPNSVTSIGYDAFYRCSNLTSVTIPSSVTSIGNYAFQGCTSLETLNFNAVSCSDFNATASYQPFYDLNIATINIGNGVRRIPAYFANGLSNISSITIPSTVTSIGNNAFYGCSSLTVLNFNATSCSDFDSTNLPFAGTLISTIQVGDNVQKIPSYFVKDLSTLRSVRIGNAVTTIGSNAFSGCYCMTDVQFGNSVTTINDNSFYGCSGLNNITLPNSLKTISYSAFEDCNQLTTVRLPSSLQIIRSKAFYNCSGLQSLYSYATTPPVMETSDCFNTYNTTSLYVPGASYGVYCNTYYWNQFNRIYAIDADGNILATGISLNATNKSLYVHQSFKLTATITPSVASNKTVTWKSSDSSIAAVDSTGLVTAIGDGTATITAMTNDGSNLSATCNVTVSSIPVTSIYLNNSSLTLDLSDTYRLYATVYPSNASYTTVAWKSSNTSIATVSSEGLITPVAPGQVTITATTTDGTNLSASCQVTIVKRVKEITLNESDLTITLPETTQLIATITPIDATYPALNWTSSNTSVATVDGNGLIQSKGTGTTTIKATTTDGSNLSASCQVTVKKQYVTSITLNESNLMMHLGETAQLIADVQPENASNPAINWTTGNTNIATVDNNGLVTAIAGGTTYVRASSTDGSYINVNCTITVLPDYYITLDTLSHVRGMAAQVMDLPVSLVNKNPISGIQFDVSLPNDVSFNLIDGEPDVWLDDARGTRTHSVSSNQLSNGNYRVLVTSSSSRDLRGNDGELVHMNLLLPQMHNTGNYTITVSNIIASEANETRHTLPNTSTRVFFYYLVGDADANGVVDIADYTATASKILGRSPSPFYYDAANVDANSSLDVVDLVGITNIALEIKPTTVRQAPAIGSTASRLLCDRLRVSAGGEAEISIGMDCAFDFAGFQMDMILPRGLTLADAYLGETASRLGLAIESLPDGRIRLLGTSFSDAEVSGLCSRLLTLRVKADRSYIQGSEIEFTDILFAERNLTGHYLDASCIEYVEPSSVYELMSEARICVENGNIIVDTPVAGTVQLIAVDGRMIEYQAQAGHNEYPVNATGIYIIHFNGKTLKVRL